MLNKNLQRVKISQVIRNQIPDFIAEENPLFVEFLQQYYRSQDSQATAADISENIDTYLKLENFQEVNYLTTSTKLTADIEYYDETINVESTDSWPDQYGLFKIDNEIITYTGKTATSFTGCVRGFSGIENLHETNNPENLVFNSTTSEDHNNNSTVTNLSNLFLQEFWKKLKIQFLPGFENRELYEDLNQSFFLSRAKDFYQTKGTDESIKILFKVLYGDSATVIKPREYLITPSNADWSVTVNLIAERVSGNPLNIKGQTLIQENPDASGNIFDIELYSLEDNDYYLIKLSRDSIVGDFVVNGFAKNTIEVQIGADKITVDSTLGFEESGILYADGQIITYTHKNSTQFLGCTGITGVISQYSGIHQYNFVYSYEAVDGRVDVNSENEVVLRITGTLSNFDLSNSEAKYLSSGDEIFVKQLGEKVDPGEYNYKFDNWFYNHAVNVKLVENSSRFTSLVTPTIVTTKTNHKFKIGDSVILSSAVGIIEISGTVTDILYDDDTAKIQNISNRFEFSFSAGVTLNNSINYIAKRNILTTVNSIYPKISGIVANIQNTYIDRDRKNLYVTASGLPSYEIDASSRKKEFISSSTPSETITTIGNHNFNTGQKVFFSVKSGKISGLSTDTSFFVNKINDTSLTLAFNPTNIITSNFVSYSGIGTGILTAIEVNNRDLTDQNLLKRIPITSKAKSTNIKLEDFTSSRTTGIFVNGVEILSSQSSDVIYYGQINQLNVLSGGKDYDVTIPPQVIVSDDYGSGVLANANTTGVIDSIVVTDPGYNFKTIPTVDIIGGNGKNATAECSLKSSQFLINFEGGVTGINTLTNAIGFATFHGFENGSVLIYKSLGNSPIGIGSTIGSTFVDGSLVDNSIYFARKVSNTSIKLMNTSSDALVGVNTINIIGVSSGSHQFIDTKIRKIIDFVQITNPGENYQVRNIEVDSVEYPPEFPGISTAFAGINTENNYIFAKGHGFETGEEIVYSNNGQVISGLNTLTKYSAIKIDDSKFKLVEKFVGVSSITGIATTAFDSNLVNNNFVNLNSTGGGTHTFSYPPVQVIITGLTDSTLQTGISTSITATPIVKGSIKDIFTKNGGHDYGAEIFNFERQPSITLSSGSGALLGARITDGKIANVIIFEPGSGYISEPELIVEGDGKFARLKTIVFNGQIVDVQIIDEGKDYNQQTTKIIVKTLGSGAKVSADIQKWVVNSYAQNEFNSDDAILITGLNDTTTSKLVSIYAPKKLRRSLGDNLDSNLNEVGINTVHSPIIGWCYDGNPIYGPYGGSSATNSINPRLMASGYSLITKPNRPSLASFPNGFFVDDYEFTSSGDLDENNGRFCITPEFPNGTYAYFAIKNDYPYVVKSFKNDPDQFNYNFTIDQNANLLLEGDIFRNNTPYRINESNAFYEGLNDFGNKKEKFIINSVISSGISSVRIIDGGINYQVGDRVSFINERTGGLGARAKVSSLKGKEIRSITYDNNTIPNITFSYSENVVTGFTTNPHGLIDGETVIISGISSSSFKFFEGSYEVGVSSVSTSLLVGIGTTVSTGIVTSIVLTESASSGRIRTDDLLTIGTEQLLVLNVLKSTNSYRIQRSYGSSVGSAHSSGDSVFLNPKRFTYNVSDNTGLNLSVKDNKTTYFNPDNSIGFGTQGTRYFVGYGVSNTTIGIQTGSITRLFFNSHSFSPADLVQIINGTPAGINTTEARVISVGSTFANIEFDSTSVSGVGLTAAVFLRKNNFVKEKTINIKNLNYGNSIPFQTFEPFTYSTNSGIGISVSEYDNLSRPFKLVNGQTILVTRLSEANDNIGIRTTRIGIGSLSTLYFVGTGNTTGIGTTGGENHSITTLNPNVTGTLEKLDANITTEISHGISTSSVITLDVVPDRTENVIAKYNSTIDTIVINPVSFASTAIGVGTTVSTININNHSFSSGDKVLYSVVGSAATSLVSGNNYFVIKDSNNFIRLSQTHAESIGNVPQSIGITTTGFGTHTLSLINPKINAIRGNKISFGMTDTSLSEFDLRFYLDPDFINEYSDVNITRTSSPKSVSIDTTLDTPEILYYTLTEKNLTTGDDYRVSIDRDVKDFSKIILNNSVYNNDFVATGIGSTTFKINLSRIPEHTSYTSTNTTTLKYTTKSPNVTGSVDSIEVNFGGVGYESLPKINSIISSNGSGAILRAFSEDIGKPKNVSALTFGYNYSADKTIVPKAEIPTLIEVKNNFTLSKVGISSRGSGYLFPPTLIVVEDPNIILQSKLTGSSVSSVEILISTGGLSEITPTIVSTNNANGVTVTNAESDGTFNTLTLRRPINGFTNFPFIVGEQIFVEGVQTSTIQSQGGGYNSSDYNYSTFPITSLINDANVSSVTYQIPVGLGTTGGIFDPDNSFGRVIKDSNLAKFVATIEEQNFNSDELIFASNGSSGRVLKNGWNSLNKILKLTNTSGIFEPGVVLSGSVSKSKGTISDVITFDDNFISGSSTIKNNGWQTESGILNNSFQRIQDSFYYQNFSYSIKSKTPISTWQDPVNSLIHVAGFKNFSDLDVISPIKAIDIIPMRVSIASSEVGTLVNIDSLLSMYTKFNFDLASEETTTESVSKFINLNSQNIAVFSQCITNKVLLIDDISPQFTGFTTTLGGNIVGLSSFALKANNQNLLTKSFNITNASVIGAGGSTIIINGHDFSTGEKLFYSPENGSRVGIATTSRVASGISTDLLPTEVYAYKVNDTTIKLAGIKTDVTTNDIFFIFRSATGIGSTVVGSGTTHTLSVDTSLANTRALITIDNVIQSPLFRKNVSTGLSTEVGIGSTTITLTGITSISTNTLLQINSEILKVGVVGFGSTNVLTTARAQFGTVATAHTVGAAVTVLDGDYTINKGVIYFDSAPYGPVGVTTLSPGISTQSSFHGRIFYRKDYETNYIFDDLSNNFTGNAGTGKTFILKSFNQNTSGVGTHNGVILINNIFQRPDGIVTKTDYELSNDVTSGITTITFTGNDRETLPRSGIINEVEVGVGTGYTTGSYSNRLLTGGFGTGAKVDIIVGAGGSVINFTIIDRGIGYKQNDVLSLHPAVVSLGTTATFTIRSTYSDKFSGWSFGKLTQIDDFSNKFDGFRKQFLLTKTIGLIPEPFSIEKSDSVTDVQSNLLVFINDILQQPIKDYVFNGGTRITFTSAPEPGAKVKILFYEGSTADAISRIPLQTIKVGDSLKLEKINNILPQLDRVVIDITSSDQVETITYSDIGISTNNTLLRPVFWTKQTSDLIIDGEPVSKNRTYLEPRINPATRLIKDFLSSDTEIYVQNINPTFSTLDESEQNSTNVTIISDTNVSSAQAQVANVSAAGTITSFIITNPGSNYTIPPTVSIRSKTQIKEIGKTWEVGVTTTINQTNLRDIEFESDDLLYVVCDDNGGISTSYNLLSWQRQTPVFADNNQINSVAYGSTWGVWVGVGSDANVGYSTNNASSWDTGVIYSYVQETGGLGRFQYETSNTTRKFYSVAYGDNKFVAVGTGATVLVSDNQYPSNTIFVSNGSPLASDPTGIGTQWLINQNKFVDINGNPTSAVTNDLNYVIYSSVDNRFVSVGNNGVIISSFMGTITNRAFRVDRAPSGGQQNLNGIVYAQNKYIIVGNNGTVGFSTLLTGPWITDTLNTTENFLSVTHKDNVFVAAGTNGVVANSVNGVNWILKNSLNSTIFSLTTNTNSVIGVGSTSGYVVSSQETNSGIVTATISSTGTVTSLNVVDGGFGFDATQNISVLISSPTAFYENIDSVAVSGDYGKIVGVGTSAIGIGTDTPMIIFNIQTDVGLNTNKIGSSSGLTPIQRSGISIGDYFVAYNTTVGKGVTSIDVSSGITTVGIGSTFIDNIYRVDHIINNGVSGVVTVFSNVKSVVGVASTAVTPDNIGFDTTGKVGNYSWGKIFNFNTRLSPKTFIINNNGFTGVQTSPLIIRRTSLKAQYD
jgi:hypothetical protein